MITESGEKLSAASGCRAEIDRKHVQMWHMPPQVYQASLHSNLRHERRPPTCLDGTAAN